MLEWSVVREAAPEDGPRAGSTAEGRRPQRDQRVTAPSAGVWVAVKETFSRSTLAPWEPFCA